MKRSIEMYHTPDDTPKVYLSPAEFDAWERRGWIVRKDGRVFVASNGLEIMVTLMPPFKRKILTEYWAKPIPMRQYDWAAWYDGKEESGPYGYGRTEAEAIADLKQWEDDE